MKKRLILTIALFFLFSLFVFWHGLSILSLLLFLIILSMLLWTITPAIERLAPEKLFKKKTFRIFGYFLLLIMGLIFLISTALTTIGIWLLLQIGEIGDPGVQGMVSGASIGVLSLGVIGITVSVLIFLYVRRKIREASKEEKRGG